VWLTELIQVLLRNLQEIVFSLIPTTVEYVLRSSSCRLILVEVATEQERVAILFDTIIYRILRFQGTYSQIKKKKEKETSWYRKTKSMALGDKLGNVSLKLIWTS
jgi:hypothetical protein